MSADASSSGYDQLIEFILNRAGVDTTTTTPSSKKTTAAPSKLAHYLKTSADFPADTMALVKKFETVVAVFKYLARHYDAARAAEENLMDKWENAVLFLPTTTSDQLADNTVAFLAMRSYKCLLSEVEMWADALSMATAKSMKNNGLGNFASTLITFVNNKAIVTSRPDVADAITAACAVLGHMTSQSYDTYRSLLAAVDAAKTQRAVVLATPKISSGVASGFMAPPPASPWDGIAANLVSKDNADKIATTTALCTSDVAAAMTALLAHAHTQDPTAQEQSAPPTQPMDEA
jgi:hypothetical protein